MADIKTVDDYACLSAMRKTAMLDKLVRRDTPQGVVETELGREAVYF
jgi:hypothetical protein